MKAKVPKLVRAVAKELSEIATHDFHFSHAYLVGYCDALNGGINGGLKLLYPKERKAKDGKRNK